MSRGPIDAIGTAYQRERMLEERISTLESENRALAGQVAALTFALETIEDVPPPMEDHDDAHKHHAWVQGKCRAALSDTAAAAQAHDDGVIERCAAWIEEYAPRGRTIALELRYFLKRGAK